MKRKIAALALACVMGVSGLGSMPVMAEGTATVQDEDSLVGIHANEDQEKTGSGFRYTLNAESQRIRILRLSQVQTSVSIPEKIGAAVVDYAGFWKSPYIDSIRSITLPDTVTTVGTTSKSGPTNGFAEMKNLEHVTLTNAVTDLGNFTFYKDAALKNLTLPEYITKIGNYVFAGCSSLTELSIPAGVTSAGEGAFQNMSSLSTIYLPKSLTKIGKYAFYGDSSLKDVYYEGTEEEWNRISWEADAKEALAGKTIHYGYQYAAKKPKPDPKEVLYRLYNPNSGEHFYTANAGEKISLVKSGWRDEGTGWSAPLNSDRAVYRLYNPNAGDHHYTLNAGERDALVKAGWKYEGIAWLSAQSSKTPVYRQYNPNAKSGAHNYTTSKAEADHLISVGWKDEGIGWYGE